MDRIPPVEETLREVVSNRYLANIIRLAHEHKEWEYGGVDCITSMVAGHDTHSDDEMTNVQHAFYHDIESMNYTEMESVIPHLRRLGYSVTFWPNQPDVNCPISINFPGYAQTHNVRGEITSGSVYLYSTSPGMMRMRGVLWCIPRVLRWKHRVLTAYYRPLAPGGIAHVEAGVEMVNGM